MQLKKVNLLNWRKLWVIWLLIMFGKFIRVYQGLIFGKMMVLDFNWLLVFGGWILIEFLILIFVKMGMILVWMFWVILKVIIFFWCRLCSEQKWCVGWFFCNMVCSLVGCLILFLKKGFGISFLSLLLKIFMVFLGSLICLIVWVVLLVI